MSIKQKLTGVAVDSLVDYLKDKLENLKQLDLDGDGRKDVDQVKELLGQVSGRVKDSLEATDFPKLASGLEQIMSGATLIGSSIDRQKLAAACTELGSAVTKLGTLLQLGVHEMKQIDTDKQKSGQ